MAESISLILLDESSKPDKLIFKELEKILVKIIFFSIKYSIRELSWYLYKEITSYIFKLIKEKFWNLTITMLKNDKNDKTKII